MAATAGDGVEPPGRRAFTMTFPSLAPVERLLLPVLRVGLILMRQARTLGSIGIILAGDQILLVRTWYRADWGLPGGYLRRSEEPVDGLVREIFEETGLRVAPDAAPMFLFQRRRRHIDFVFTVHVASREDARGGDSSEITRMEWFEFADLPRLQPEAEAALRAAGLLQEGPSGDGGQDPVGDAHQGQDSR